MCERGKVRFFHEQGWGFIRREFGKRDAFVHYSDIIGDGHRDLEEGEPVEFEIEKGKRGPRAINVRRITEQEGVSNEPKKN